MAQPVGTGHRGYSRGWDERVARRARRARRAQMVNAPLAHDAGSWTPRRCTVVSIEGGRMIAKGTNLAQLMAIHGMIQA
jgi:hypothetical protein